MNRPRVRVRWTDEKEARQITETVIRLKLDRRKVYSLAWDDVLGTMESFVGACTGKRRVWYADPVVVNGQFVNTGKKETTDELAVETSKAK